MYIDLFLACADQLISCAKDMKLKIWSVVFEDTDLDLCSLVCMQSVSHHLYSSPCPPVAVCT